MLHVKSALNVYNTDGEKFINGIYSINYMSGYTIHNIDIQYAEYSSCCICF